MNIGDKIKQTRQEKSLSQENVYPSNQSLVSQIEKGVNKNPTEQTLRIMAGNMGLSFEKLIEGTTWELPRNVSRKSEYAFSQTECIVTIEDSGEIKTQMKSYPLVEDTGEENKFDPDTGYKLLTECKVCKRNINQNNQKYCLGCGKRLFKDYSFTGKVFNLPLDPEGKLVKKHLENIKPDMEEKDKKVLIHDLGGPDSSPKIFNTGYTWNREDNNESMGNLSILLGELMTIEKLVNPDLTYIESGKLGRGTDAILTRSLIRNYNFYFKNYYLMMTGNQAAFSDIIGLPQQEREKVLAGGPENNKIHYFHPYNTIPFEVVEDKSIEEQKKGYEGGFMLHDLVDIHPNEIKNEIIENWWVQFQFDLSMTKGIISEMTRHQLKIDKWFDNQAKEYAGVIDVLGKTMPKDKEPKKKNKGEDA